LIYESVLDRLLAEFSLPEGWSFAPPFMEVATVLGVDFFLCGFLAQRADGLEVTGSAADFRVAPVERAFFETLERIATVQADAEGGMANLVDAEGHFLGRVDVSELFPKSTEPQTYVFAKSNGMAIHRDRHKAIQSAFNELVERDRILRSWFGGPAPQVFAEPGFVPDAQLAAGYNFSSYLFSNETAHGSEIAVAGFFGFPIDPKFPLVYGFGAASAPELAAAKARDGGLQRLGFLWGEELPTVEPDFSPTGLFHQELYLNSIFSEKKLGHWLSGGHVRTMPIQWPRLAQAAAAGYADLTPSVWQGRLSVIKAVDPKLLPLFFGRAFHGSPALGDLGETVHPIP
jgi:hypothetical protein